MATQAPSDSFYVSAQDVGNVFVDKYYHLLHRSPELVHKFYDNKSLLSRPGPNSEMTSVTTIQGINEKVMSFDYKDSTTEIISVDAQESLMEGVIVAVTGCWTRKDNARRQFTQMFFLAKQDKGYYVLNDVFRFVDVHKQSLPLAVLDIDKNVPTASLTKDPEPGLVPNHTSTPIKIVSDNVDKVSDPSDVQDSGVEKGSAPKNSVNSSENDVLPVALSGSNNHKDAPPKLSYASMVAKKSIASSPLHAPACVIVRVAPSSDQQPPASAAPKARAASVAPKARAASAAPKASDPHGSGAPQSSRAHTEVKSIYVGNLPEDITKNQLIGIFKKFGTIKEDGVQLRNPEEVCFIAEFVHSTSKMDSVLHLWNLYPPIQHVWQLRYLNQNFYSTVSTA
ncbi:unnamed protein product [Ilex paraguariensis]|uniref:NTF2 domain-containing protein n=1 Tax=Ilex paraguariensis TaxID=185542 RepID=A0ABC8RIB6_9AQUA